MLKYKLVLLYTFLAIGCTNQSNINEKINTSNIDIEKLSNYTKEQLISEAQDLLLANEIDKATLIYRHLLKQKKLNYYYDVGVYWLQKNNKTGEVLLDSGAIMGDPTSALALGFLYIEGQSSIIDAEYKVPKNIEKGIYYLKIASQYNDMLSQLNLAFIYNDSMSNYYNSDSAKFYLKLCKKNKSEDEEGSIDIAKKYFTKWFPNETW